MARILTFLLLFASQHVLALESLSLSPKIFSRMGGGLIKNSGTTAGSSLSLGGVSLGGVYFLTSQIALSGAYRLESNLRRIPMQGWDISTRYYYLDAGTKITRTAGEHNRIVTHNTLSPYAGAEYSQRSYRFEADPTSSDPDEQSLKGSSSSANIVAGLDYRLSQSWELGAEISYTLLAFGGSDARVKLRWILFSLGINYVF